MKHGGYVSSVAFRPDGETLLTGSHDQTVRLWSRSPPRPLGLPLAHQSEVLKAVFNPDGKRVLTVTKERTVRLWDVAGCSASTLDLLGHQAECWAVAFSPDGKHVLTGSFDHTARLWTPRRASASQRLFSTRIRWRQLPSAPTANGC